MGNGKRVAGGRQLAVGEIACTTSEPRGRLRVESPVAESKLNSNASRQVAGLTSTRDSVAASRQLPAASYTDPVSRFPLPVPLWPPAPGPCPLTPDPYTLSNLRPTR